MTSYTETECVVITGTDQEVKLSVIYSNLYTLYWLHGCNINVLWSRVQTNGIIK